jgi:hypothetical protein
MLPLTMRGAKYWKAAFRWVDAFAGSSQGRKGRGEGTFS